MFRFTIRDVLWLTVVVAMGLGWWVERKRLAENLAVTRIHASDLQQNLLGAQWLYAPRTHSSPFFGSGEWGEINWRLTEQPIP